MSKIKKFFFNCKENLTVGVRFLRQDRGLIRDKEVHKGIITLFQAGIRPCQFINALWHNVCESIWFQFPLRLLQRVEQMITKKMVRLCKLFRKFTDGNCGFIILCISLF